MQVSTKTNSLVPIKISNVAVVGWGFLIDREYFDELRKLWEEYAEKYWFQSYGGHSKRPHPMANIVGKDEAEKDGLLTLKVMRLFDEVFKFKVYGALPAPPDCHPYRNTIFLGHRDYSVARFPAHTCQEPEDMWFNLEDHPMFYMTDKTKQGIENHVRKEFEIDKPISFGIFTFQETNSLERVLRDW